MKVIVVGGGIAGLSLALSLHQAGIAVRLYEAVQDLRPLGVGINLQPTAVRELTELGLGAELAEIGIATQQLSYFSKFGQLVWSEVSRSRCGIQMAAVFDSSRPLADDVAACSTPTHWPRQYPRRTAIDVVRAGPHAR